MPKQVRYFEVLEGTHETGFGDNRKQYTKGDIVHSEKDLAAIFVNKFKERFFKKGKAPEDEGKAPRSIQEDPTLERVPDNQKKIPENADPTTDTNDETQSDDEDEDEAGEEVSAFGVDATDQFEVDSDVNLGVYKKGKKYTVVDKDRPTIALNKEPLKTPKDVKLFLKSEAKKKR